MNQQQYEKLLAWCRSTPQKEKILTRLCQYSPVSVIIIYAVMILYLIFKQDSRLRIVVLIPFIDLVIITLLRKILKKPRPQEIYPIKPLISHHLGDSCPSRHTASAFIIAFSCFYIYPPIGVLCFIIALYVTISRIIAGVHFIRDVLIGAIISIVIGYLGFF